MRLAPRRRCRLAPAVLLLPALGLSASWCVPARAADDAATQEVLTSIDRDLMLEILRAEGYAADVDARGVIIWKIEGCRSQIFIDEDTGTTVQYHISFSDGNATLERVNDWNRTKRYSRTFLDEEGDPHLVLDLDVEGGVTRERVADFIKTCRVSMKAWCTEVVE